MRRVADQKNVVINEECHFRENITQEISIGFPERHAENVPC